MNSESINIQIKKLRKKLGLTQIEFAKRAEIGLRFLRELEQGKKTVRLDKLNQVLDFLGMHLELKRNEDISQETESKNSKS
jgi:y4mF family transcriptional regulator